MSESRADKENSLEYTHIHLHLHTHSLTHSLTRSSMSEDSDSPSDYSDYSDPEPTDEVPELTLGVNTVTPKGDKNASVKDLSIILPKLVTQGVSK